MSQTTSEPPLTDGETGPEKRTAAGHPGNGGAGPHEDLSERLATRLLEHAAEGARHLRTLASVASERAHLRFRRTRWTLVQVLVLALVSGVLAVGGALYFARGLAGLLAALLGSRPWLGELAAGLLLMSLVAAGLVLVMALDERRELERLRRKYGSDDGAESGTPRAEGEDGRRTPAGGAGARAGGSDAQHREPRD